MINLQTYRLEPYFAANARTKPITTEWLRETINKEVRDKREALEQEDVDTSLFYNHDPETGITRIGYPLIIYHYIEGIFYITGINDGAFALDKLAELYQSPFTMDEMVFKGFRKEKTGGEFDLATTSKPQYYQLVEWLPLHHKDLKAFRKMDLVAKATALNQRLEKHIIGELGKYLGLSFNPFDTVITDITRVYQHPVIYKGYEYPAYDIRFTANVLLPGMITLGNNKAHGYGRVEPL